MLFQLSFASSSVIFISNEVERFRKKWKDFERNVNISNEMERFRTKWKDFEQNGKILNEM